MIAAQPNRCAGLAQAALGFVQFADVFEDFAGRGRRFVLRQFVLALTDQLAQVLAVGVGVFDDKFFQGVVVAVE